MHGLEVFNYSLAARGSPDWLESLNYNLAAWRRWQVRGAFAQTFRTLSDLLFFELCGTILQVSCRHRKREITYRAFWYRKTCWNSFFIHTQHRTRGEVYPPYGFTPWRIGRKSILRSGMRYKFTPPPPLRHTWTMYSIGTRTRMFMYKTSCQTRAKEPELFLGHPFPGSCVNEKMSALWVSYSFFIVTWGGRWKEQERWVREVEKQREITFCFTLNLQQKCAIAFFSFFELLLI
jgi:hypothetical protein